MAGKRRLQMGSGRWIAYGVFVASPVILLLALSSIFNQNAFMGIAVWSDELVYWREVLLFAVPGPNTGYIGFEELVAKAGSFGAHGFFPALFYYPFAKIAGWGANGIVMANLTFTVICFALVLYLVKPSVLQAMAAAFLYLFFPPIILYAPSSMTEMVNYGFLGLFCAAFYRHRTAGSERERKKYFALMLIIGAICSLYRITYFALFLAPLIAVNRLRPDKKLLGSLALWLGGSVGLYLFSSTFTAPYPYGVLFKALNSGGLQRMKDILSANAQMNITRFFDLKHGTATETGLRYFYLICLLLSLLAVFFKISKGPSFGIFLRDTFEVFHVIQFAVLFVPLCAVIVLYDVVDWRDFRTLAPFLWMILLNLVFQNRKGLCAALAPVFFLYFMITASHWPTNFCMLQQDRYPVQEIDASASSAINDLVEYNPDAEDPFENTIFYTKLSFSQDLYFNLRPGIGIHHGALKEDFNSKYILTDADLEIEGYTVAGTTAMGYLHIKDS